MSSSVAREVSNLKADMSSVKTEMKIVSQDLDEIKKTQRELLEFMYRMSGGYAWLMGMLTVAGTIGSILTTIVHNILTR